MQELRFVLIIVGALAIAALLFHGLWTSKKEGKAKFADKPLGRIDVEHDEEDTPEAQERAFAPEDDYEIIRKDKHSANFSVEPAAADPLIDGYHDAAVSTATSEPGTYQAPAEPTVSDRENSEDDLPSIKAFKDLDEELDKQPAPFADAFSEIVEEQPAQEAMVTAAAPTEPEPKPEPEMQVIVLNVHCAGEEPFVGTKLFDSMQQNGLLYGEMDIFHRHADLSGTGKILFSVANMMQPGTLQHDDPADFTTKGISFFMTLPCFGEADQNFKLMLKTAQQIADDMGGNVLDDHRNLMTPTRLDTYRKQIQDFKAAQSA
ncbi:MULTISPECIES: cell division protein ZipA [Vibrio]|uniref:Cell division protein ZipA n=1 Tax=Vibrio proteolyticus NBRC 13287 TaxID=1219065 RepID=U3B7F2_VIBPR|nr:MULTISPECIES: cell division protein ZipA [Vibrio]NAW58395.1 cell division protein ZipA [Vibrio sp. V36_P2S2PM302]NAX27080.1 cell division protein ZipA [Vibrio sp. V38_P2S17PM301]NAX32670.1 cell division protein ZipA [Vibrio sp. V37_P2S8PM304]GAD65779.1 cell division protein ZipA homolog [Vibrio proteolyticus NBRC 13287]